MTKHNPTPWHYFDGSIQDGEGEPVADVINSMKRSTPNAQENTNGEFITRAANAHDDLVAALKAARKYLEDRGIRERGIVGRTKLLPQIDAALIKAEKNHE